jgi:hypothetical protein
VDYDFDFIIKKDGILILHPNSFIYLNDIDEIILSTISTSVSTICSRMNNKILMPFINQNMKKAKTIARLISAIRLRDDLERTSIEKLKEKCKLQGVLLNIKDDVIIPDENNVEEFLEILDRRAFDVSLLSDDSLELYLANSRIKKN